MSRKDKNQRPGDLAGEEPENAILKVMGGKYTRRQVLAGTAGLSVSAFLSQVVEAQGQVVPEDTTKVQGEPATEVSRGRSPFEAPKYKRRLQQVYAGIYQTANTNQALFMGTITPSDMHFERHHGGIPQIDPRRYKLLIHGLVDRPKVFTLDDLKRLPQVTFPYFIECAGDSTNHWPLTGIPTGEKATILDTHPIYSNSEWTGVPLSLLFREVGVKKEARWLLAESYDGAVMSRSVPVSKAYEDAIIAYGQNGEPVRPEQGYPARLLCPGWEGNISVKWIRRIKLSDRPFMVRDETSKYSDPYPKEGKTRQFSFTMDAKSVIVYPSGGMKMPGTGWVEIWGLAWSGLGRINRVEVSTDGGKTWGLAALQEPILPKTSTIFRYPWFWDGQEAIILSRATDGTGYVQPTRNQLLQARGQSIQHFNGIQAWKIKSDEKVVHTYHEEPLPGYAMIVLPDNCALLKIG